MIRIAFTLLATFGLLTACADDPAGPVDPGPEDPPPPVEVDTIELVGVDFELSPGETLQLTARARSANGEVLPGHTFTWATDDDTVATVEAGLVTAVAPGEVIISATTGDVTGGVILTVVDDEPPAAVDHVTVDRDQVTLVIGGAVLLDAQPRDADGAPLDRAITWSSSAPDIVAVNEQGAIVALAVGSADVTATSEGKSATVRVNASWILDHPLGAVSGAPLPALLGRYTEVIPDVGTVTRELRVTGGSLVIDYQHGTYELEVSATQTTVQAAVPVLRTYRSEGTVNVDETTGPLTFQPAEGDAFVGTWTPQGALQLRMQLEPAIGGLATLLFRAP